MSIQNSKSNETNVVTAAGVVDTRLRGGELGGAEQRSAVDHADYEKSRNPDVELHLDGGDGSLYGDGLDIGDDEPLAGTDGNTPKGIKG